jgi:hypothetical protein
MVALALGWSRMYGSEQVYSNCLNKIHAVCGSAGLSHGIITATHWEAACSVKN